MGSLFFAPHRVPLGSPRRGAVRVARALSSSLSAALCLCACSVQPAARNTIAHDGEDDLPGPSAPAVPEQHVVAGPVRIHPVSPDGQAGVWLLWEAGPMDASAPQVATVAAERLAAALDAEVELSPGRIAIGLRGPAGDLDAATRALIDALASPPEGAFSREAVSAARDALPARRRAALGRRGAIAERAALTALFGDEARGRLDPLGEAEDDDEVTPDALARFVSRNAGRDRVSLVLVGGAIDDETVARADRALRALPERAPEDARPSPEAARRAEVVAAAHDGFAIAAVVRDGAAARGILEALRLGAPGVGYAGGATELRGRMLVIASGIAPHEHFGEAGQRTAEAARIALAGARIAARTPSRDPFFDALSLATREVGAPDAAPPQFALGAALAAGTGRRAERRVRDAEASLRRIVRQEPPGVRAATHRTGPALRLRSAGRAAMEPPAVRGRAALFAAVLSGACARSPHLDAVDARIDGGDLTIEAWGASAPLAFLALERCASAPRARPDVERGRLALLGALDTPSERIASAMAARLAPMSPGALYPYGDPTRIVALTADDLAREGRALFEAGFALSIRADAAPLAGALGGYVHRDDDAAHAPSFRERPSADEAPLALAASPASVGRAMRFSARSDAACARFAEAFTEDAGAAGLHLVFGRAVATAHACLLVVAARDDSDDPNTVKRRLAAITPRTTASARGTATGDAWTGRFTTDAETASTDATLLDETWAVIRPPR